MPKHLAVIKQGGGCDYTIACGTHVVIQGESEKYENVSPDETSQEFADRVMSNYGETEGLEEIRFFKIEEVNVVKKKVITHYDFE